MTDTKNSAIDQITVLESGAVLFRQNTRITGDNNEINIKYHRASLIPGQDLTDVPTQVAAICNTVWTPEVIAAYEAAQQVRNG